jgi:GntR family transcriptional regulator
MSTPEGEAEASRWPQIVVDRASPVPLYYQVAQQLEAAITSGQLSPGMRLENELALAVQLGLSRPTVRQTMQYLVDKGLIVRRPGIGTRVVVSPQIRPTLELTSLWDDLMRTGQRPATRVLAFRLVPATDAVAAALLVPRGSLIAKLVRLRYALALPIARMTNYLPADLLELSKEALEKHGLYELIRAAGVRLHAGSQVVSARKATTAEARQLHESPAAALLVVRRITSDDTGRVVEYGDHILAASRYSLEFGLLAQPP